MINIKVFCDCGTELKVGGKTRLTHLDELLLITEPCTNKKCDKGICGDCEELITFRKESMELEKQIQDLQALMKDTQENPIIHEDFDVAKKAVDTHAPSCFNDYFGHGHANDACGTCNYVIGCRAGSKKKD